MKVGARGPIPAIVLVVLLAVTAAASRAQDLNMVRTNTAGNWRVWISNYGILFHHPTATEPLNSAGGLWTGSSTRPGNTDTLIFAAGLWIGGLHRVGKTDSLAPVVEYGYDASRALTSFRPGSAIYNGVAVDSSQQARDKYRVYKSNDIVGSPWPIRKTNDASRFGGEYIDDLAERVTAGPAFTLGDEDMFAVSSDVYGDTTKVMGLEIRTQVSFWNKGTARDIIVVHNEIVRPFGDTLFDPIVAVIMDGDIQDPNDDRAKTVEDEGGRMPIFYSTGDSNDPILGLVMLRGQYGSNRTESGMTSLRYWNRNDDPSDDSSRFDFVSVHQYDTATSMLGDARVAMSSASPVPFTRADTLFFDYAVFALPSEGRNALDRKDSARALHFGYLIRNLYRQVRLSELGVRPSQSEPQTLNLRYDPSNSAITLEGYTGPRIQLQVLNELGQTMGNYFIDSNKLRIDVSSWAQGTYFVQSMDGGVRNIFQFLR